MQREYVQMVVYVLASMGVSVQLDAVWKLTGGEGQMHDAKGRRDRESFLWACGI